MEETRSAWLRPARVGDPRIPWLEPRGVRQLLRNRDDTPRIAWLATRIPRPGPAAAASTVPAWSAKETPRPAIDAARPGMTQARMANKVALHATINAVSAVGSPPPAGKVTN